VPDPRGAAGKGVKGGWRLPGLAGRGRDGAGATGQEGERGREVPAMPVGGPGRRHRNRGIGARKGAGQRQISRLRTCPQHSFPNTGWEGPGSPEGRSMSRRPQARGSHLPPTPCSPFGAASATFGIGMCAAHRDTAQDEPWGIAEG
jgi:hypothetical protein